MPAGQAASGGRAQFDPTAFDVDEVNALL